MWYFVPKKVKNWVKSSKDTYIPQVVFKICWQNLKKTIDFVFKVSDFSHLSQCVGKLRLKTSFGQNRLVSREPRYFNTINHNYLTKCDILYLKKAWNWGKKDMSYLKSYSDWVGQTSRKPQIYFQSLWLFMSFSVSGIRWGWKPHLAKLS